MIDFASLVFHCVGSAIYIHLGGIGYSADQGLLRLTPFPWSPRQCATRKPYTVRLLLLFLCIVSCKPDNAQQQQKPLERVAFLLRIALVIPAGWSVSAPDAHRGHFFRLTLHSLMRFSTLKFRTKIYLIFSSSTADLVRYSLGKSICNCNRGIRDSNSTTLKFVILCEPIKDFILFSQPP